MIAFKSIAITYVPADCGSIIPGKSKAPQAFKDVGLARRLRDAGREVTEYEALENPATYAICDFERGSIRNHDVNVEVCQKVYNSASALLRPVDQPDLHLVIGGECCMLPAIMSAYWHHMAPDKKVGLLYIDADTDLASPTDAGSTGIFAGMNTTHLLGLGGALPSMRPFARRSGEPVCDASNMVFFGTNFAAPGNKKEHFSYLFDNNFRVFSSKSVAEDPQGAALKALEYLESRVDHIVVHLDMDSIDPQMFPLANVPNFTGVRFEQMMNALTVFLTSKKVLSLVIAEVNPDHDPGLILTRRLSDWVVGTVLLATQ